MAKAKSKSNSNRKKPASASNIIARLEFSETHFKAATLPTDFYYVGLANRLLAVIHKVMDDEVPGHLDMKKRMAITLACYVEDLVSGSGIWGAFMSLYRKKYKKRMPFYDINEHPFDDELP